MDLLLIRHAQTHSNVIRALDTALPGADLTDLGERQVSDLAGHLADEPIDAVWCSPALRARRTAAGLAAPRGLEPQVHPGLVEISAGDWEMSSRDEHADAYRDGVVAGLEGHDGPIVPGGESAAAAIARFDGAVAAIRAGGHRRVAVVSHGAMLRAWCGLRVANVPVELVRDRPLGNTGLVRLHARGDRWLATEWDTEVVEPGGEAGPAAEPA
jgi:probable phosphoglycerate mutase